MGYHLKEIEKGELGKFSKIKEEFQELEDAVNQYDEILILCELSDLYGAMELYIENFGMNMQSLEKFSNKTKQSFKEGKR